jgi:AcrR family transcriptional regulator
MTESRREREKETRRQLIIDTAGKVFLERGFEPATMDEIAKLSEFTKRSVYSYFPSKDELFAAVILKASESLYRLFVETVSERTTGFERIAGTGEAYIRFYREYPLGFRLLSMRRHGGMEQNGEYREKIQKLWAGVSDIMMKSFELGRKDGTIRADIDAKTGSIHLMCASNGILEFVAAAGKDFKKRYGMNAEDFIVTSMTLLGDSIKIQK